MVLERREVQPQLGLLKSTMLQLDATFSEKAYGCGSFSDFVEKLKANGYVNLSGSEGRYFIERKTAAQPEQAAAAAGGGLAAACATCSRRTGWTWRHGCLADQLQANGFEQEHPGLHDCRIRLPGVRRTVEFRPGQAFGESGAGSRRRGCWCTSAPSSILRRRRSRSRRPRPRRWRSRSLSSEDSPRLLPSPSLSPSPPRPHPPPQDQ